MSTLRNDALRLGFGLLLCATVANAGFGDLVKEKAKGMKSLQKAKPAATATNGESGAITSRIEPAATPEQLAKFKAALQVEGAERAKATKYLGTLKTPQEFEKCRMAFMQSPDGMKLSEKFTNMPENASMEERQKIVMEFNADLDKALAGKCGPDPNKVNSEKLMRDALAKGSDAFTKDDNQYAGYKEWALAFCEYVEALKKAPDSAAKLAKLKTDGLRVPGSGTGVYYVYTATEANLLLDQCESLVPLIKATM